MNPVYYIAYGSNLNLNSFFKRCPKAKLRGFTYLQDYTLVFKGSEDNISYLTLEEEMGNVVPVGVFELSAFDISNLDKYEGFPALYHKKKLPIFLKGKQLIAMTYVINSEFDYHLPSINYIRQCVKGYKCFNFDLDYLANAILKTSEKINKTR